MSDLISRQDAIDKAINIPIAKIVTEDKVIYRKAVFVEELEKLPSVNVKPVVEGEWVFERDSETSEYGQYHCSNCGGSPLQNGDESDALSKYCPRCGAKLMAEK